tara:strand:- start:816 stop:1004 length:189 start_codon:yes stop_codon:yes gene_type:complete
MQPIIKKLQEKLRFDFISLDLLSELNKQFLAKEERIKELEISNDLSNTIIEASNEGFWHGKL